MEKPFKDREELKADIRNCDMAGAIVVILTIIFAALGVIGDALDLTLVLEPTSWLLLAIVFAIASLGPQMNKLTAKHLYGIESELKKEQ